MIDTPRPFAPGTFSIGVYTDTDDPRDALDGLFRQARAAEAAGFDGVTISEHHAGFPTYVPNPLQVAGWILDRVDRIWVGACPILLPLRPAAIVAEEAAWLSALHRGRVGVGAAPGYAARDFEALGADFDDRAGAFRDRLSQLAVALSGHADGPLADDPAIRAAGSRPVPLVAAAGSPGAARRAGQAGCGMITDSLAPLARVRELREAYLANGGTGPVVVNRRAWVGTMPGDLLRRQLATYDGAARDGTLTTGAAGREALVGKVEEVAAALVEVFRATDADHIGLKVHMAGLTTSDVLVQLRQLGQALRLARTELAGRS